MKIKFNATSHCSYDYVFLQVGNDNFDTKHVYYIPPWQTFVNCLAGPVLFLIQFALL